MIQKVDIYSNFCENFFIKSDTNNFCKIKNREGSQFMTFGKSSEVQNDEGQLFCTERAGDKLIEQSYQVGHTSDTTKKAVDFDEKSPEFSLPFIKILPIMLTLCLSGFYFGYTVVYLSAVEIADVIQYYGVTMRESLALGVLNGLVSIGGGLGCLLAKIFLNNFSRKNSLLMSNYIAFISGCLLFVPNQVTVLVMRLAQGICVGLYCTMVPMYIRQLSPLHMAGTFGVLFQFSMAFGTVFCFLLSYILRIIGGDNGQKSLWFAVFGFPLFTLSIQTLLISFKYPFQTPKYLILNKQQEQLKELLKNFYHKKYIEKVAIKLKNNILSDQNEIVETRRQANNENSEISSDTIKSLQKQLIVVQENKHKTPLIAFVTACFMSFSQQMVGLGCIVIYGSQLVGQLLPSLSHQSGIIINAPQLISSLILSYLLSKYNRKLILQCGMVSLAVINGVIGVAFLLADNDKDVENKDLSWSYVILAGQFLYNAVYAISVGSMLWVFLPALIQPNQIAVASFMNWVSSAIVLILFPLLKEQLPNQNPGFLFIFFAGYTLLCFFLYAKIVIEIKNKTQREISEQYRKMKVCT